MTTLHLAIKFERVSKCSLNRDELTTMSLVTRRPEIAENTKENMYMQRLARNKKLVPLNFEFQMEETSTGNVNKQSYVYQANP